MNMEHASVTKEKTYGAPKLKIPIPIAGLNCPGCGHSLFVKALCEVLEEMKIDGKVACSVPVGCSTLALTLCNFDTLNAAHGAGPAIATGVKRVHGDNLVVLSVQGDGDCAAIGGGYLINAAARSEKISVFLLNNGNFGTTGGQLAPTTIVGQVTSTTPKGRDPAVHGYPLNTAEMLSAIKGVAYSARGALTSPANYRQVKGYIKIALQKQIDNIGFSFVEILVACPPNWHLTPVESMKWMEEKMVPVFPLGEFKNVDMIE